MVFSHSTWNIQFTSLQVLTCSESTVETPEQGVKSVYLSDVFIVNFKSISNQAKTLWDIFITTFLLTLDKYFCFSLFKYLFVSKQVKLPVPFFIVESTVMCIAHNIDHPLLCCVFHLTLSLPVNRCLGHNADLPLNSNSSNFLTISRLVYFALVVLQLLMFKVFGITAISEIKFRVFPVLKGLKKLKTLKNLSLPAKFVRQPLFK